MDFLNQCRHGVFILELYSMTQATISDCIANTDFDISDERGILIDCFVKFKCIGKFYAQKLVYIQSIYYINSILWTSIV